MATMDRIGLWEAFSSELGRGSAAMGTPMVFTVGDIMAAGLSGAATMAAGIMEAADSWGAVTFAEGTDGTAEGGSTVAVDYTAEAAASMEEGAGKSERFRTERIKNGWRTRQPFSLLASKLLVPAKGTAVAQSLTKPDCIPCI